MPINLLILLVLSTIATAFFLMVIFKWKFKKNKDGKKTNVIIRFFKLLTIIYGLGGGFLVMLFYNFVGITLDLAAHLAFLWCGSAAFLSGVVAVWFLLGRNAILEKRLKSEKENKRNLGDMLSSSGRCVDLTEI